MAHFSLVFFVVLFLPLLTAVTIFSSKPMYLVGQLAFLSGSSTHIDENDLNISSKLLLSDFDKRVKMRQKKS